MQSIKKPLSPHSARNHKLAGAPPTTHRVATFAEVAVLVIDDSPIAVLRPDPAAAFIGIGSSTLSEKVKIESDYYDPDMPKAIELGGRNRGFLVHELLAYLALKAAQRDQENRS